MRNVFSVALLALLAGCASTSTSNSSLRSRSTVNEYRLPDNTGMRYKSAVVTVNTIPVNTTDWPKQISRGEGVKIPQLPVGFTPQQAQHRYIDSNQTYLMSTQMAQNQNVSSGTALVGGIIAGAIVNAVVQDEYREMLRNNSRIKELLKSVDFNQNFTTFPEIVPPSWATTLSTEINNEQTRSPASSVGDVFLGNLTWTLRPVFTKRRASLCFDFSLMASRETPLIGDRPSVVHLNLCAHEQSSTDLDSSIANWESNDGELVDKAFKMALPLMAKGLTFSLEKEMLEPQVVNNEQRMARIKSFYLLFTQNNEFLNASYQVKPIATYYIDFSV